MSVVLPPRSLDPEQILAALDQEQRAVATALHGPVVVLAGAGTGKTRAITHRIAYGAATGELDPRRVLALTFTNRAAGEMRSRLGELGSPGVQARTFHSAALRQASFFWPRVYRSELPPIVENRFGIVAEAARSLQLATDTAVLRDFLGEITWSKVSNVTPEAYPSVARRAGRELAAADTEAVGRIFARYEDLKRDRGIDFEDILLCTASLLADNQDVADEVRRAYQHFVVDEYQDTSPLQQSLLDLWLGGRNSICVVGDPAQTIHSFAGARANYLTGFSRRYHQAREIRLVRDYRSTPEVVAVANRILAGRGATLELRAQQPSGPEPIYRAAEHENAEAELVAQWLAERHADGRRWGEMAVLFRINAQSPALEQALAGRGIPYLVRGAERFYERGEVRQVLTMLVNQVRNGQVLAPELKVTNPLEVAGKIMELAGWQPEPPKGAAGAVRERWESLAALWAAICELAADGADFALVVGRLEERAAAQQVPQADGVTLATIHSAKGLEWEAVAIVGVQEGSLPFALATTPAQLAEERRLFYVAVTRAKQQLHISWATARVSGGRERRPSRFLKGLRPTDDEVVARGRTKGAEVEKCRTCRRPLRTGAERKLGRHGDCPATYNLALLAALKQWRSDQAVEQRLPAYCVFTDATLTAIAESTPASVGQLLAVRGVGQAKADRYGADVLAIVAAQPTKEPDLD